MHHDIVTGLAVILALGIGGQWIAWRFGLPSILVLLVFGFVAGPTTGYLVPDELFGDLLPPVVSLAVAVILFEGGLNLRLVELRRVGRVVLGLITVGIAVTWAIAAAAAWALLGFSPGVAVLFGAVLVISGPTVILPILRHVRPTGRVAAAVKWEGIVNDPIGAVLAVLVFEAILPGGPHDAASHAAWGVARTLVCGLAGGFVGAALLVLLLRYYLVPDYLQSLIALMVAVALYTGANQVQDECGLLAVTVMGIVLASQRVVDIKHIIEFKENLGVLFVSLLFVVLAARVDVGELKQLDWRSAVFVLVLVLAARPAAVWASTAGTDFHWRERTFLAWMAPRGVVAVAVISVFAGRLAAEDVADAGRMVPMMFLVVACTVATYGLSAGPLARGLGLAEASPQGVLLVGAHSWARAIAKVLQEEGFRVFLVDNNYRNIAAARMAGLPTHYGNVVSESTLDEVNLHGIGRILALTSNDEANALAALHFAQVFERAGLYQLQPEKDARGGRERDAPGHLRGRFLFAEGATYTELSRRFAAGAQVRRTQLTEEFSFAAFRERHGDAAIPLFRITEEGRLLPFTASDPTAPKPGDRLISLTYPEDSVARGKEEAKPEPAAKP